jgi:hypothetical protein
MSHHLPPELIFAGALWLTAIILFLIMLIATLASLRSTGKTEVKSTPKTELKFSSVVERFSSKGKIKNRP